MITYANKRLAGIANRLADPNATGLRADDARYLMMFIAADSSAHNQAACTCGDCKTFRAASDLSIDDEYAEPRELTRDEQDMRDNPHPEET